MTKRSEPTLLDRGFQLAYVCAYRAMRTYWKVRRPTTHGTLIALWNRDEVLLVRNSYVPYYCLPGGYLQRGETARAAAVRELHEEVGITAEPDKLELVLDRTHDWEGKRDHVQIFALESVVSAQRRGGPSRGRRRGVVDARARALAGALPAAARGHRAAARPPGRRVSARVIVTGAPGRLTDNRRRSARGCASTGRRSRSGER